MIEFLMTCFAITTTIGFLPYLYIVLIECDDENIIDFILFPINYIKRICNKYNINKIGMTILLILFFMFIWVIHLGLILSYSIVKIGIFIRKYFIIIFHKK